MLVKGDVKCLHCGFISGQWVGPSGAPLTFAGMNDAGARAGADKEAMLRCNRCGGPVLLDEVTPVISGERLRRIHRLREQLAELDARRGHAA